MIVAANGVAHHQISVELIQLSVGLLHVAPGTKRERGKKGEREGGRREEGRKGRRGRGKEGKRERRGEGEGALVKESARIVTRILHSLGQNCTQLKE